VDAGGIEGASSERWHAGPPRFLQRVRFTQRRGDNLLEVRRGILPATIRSWAGKQATLMNHIKTGGRSRLVRAVGMAFHRPGHHIHS
jgi:hypothetical protein